jgi:hypothetical protein
MQLLEVDCQANVYVVKLRTKLTETCCAKRSPINRKQLSKSPWKVRKQRHFWQRSLLLIIFTWNCFYYVFLELTVTHIDLAKVSAPKTKNTNMLARLVIIALLCFLFVSAHVPENKFGSIVSLLEAGHFIWEMRDKISSCGNYLNTVINNKFVVQWTWRYTKATYVFDRSTNATNYFPGCQSENFYRFKNSQFNVLHSIAGCEAGMSISGSTNDFERCILKVFESKTVYDCERQCGIFGCPDFKC